MTIDIKAQLALLKELQDIDMVVREIEEELASMPQKIEGAKAAWLELSEKLREKETEKNAGVKQRKDLEIELEDTTRKLQERETRLFTIKTNKEYQAAIKEIADGKKANKEREDVVIKLMEKIEGLTQEITQLSGAAADKEKEFRTKEDEFLRQKSELEKRRDGQVQELKKIEPKVDKKLLEQYSFIRTRYLDPMAAVVGGICQGCNMNIPPQMYNELLKGLKIHFCSNCHRFVYVDETKKEEGLSANEA